MFSSLSQIVNGIKIAVLKESCNKIRAAKVRGADDSIPVRFLTFCKCRISLSCKLPAPRDNAADPDPHGSPWTTGAESASKSKGGSGSESESKLKQELQMLKRKPWRAVDAHNGGVEARNGAMEGVYCVCPWSQIFITLRSSRIRIRNHIKVKGRIRIGIKVKGRIRIRIKMKGRIRIRIKVMRIRNTATRDA